MSDFKLSDVKINAHEYRIYACQIVIMQDLDYHFAYLSIHALFSIPPAQPTIDQLASKYATNKCSVREFGIHL